MDKERFSELLEDLYSVYNPSGKQHIPELVERYNRLEFDAVKNIFIKYNHSRKKFYDPNKGTDDYILDLIKKYTAGNRVFQSVNLEEELKLQEESEQKTQNSKEREKEEKTERKLQELRKGLSGQVEEKLGVITELLDNKEKELSKLYTKKISEVEEQLKKTIDELTTDDLKSINKNISELKEEFKKIKAEFHEWRYEFNDVFDESRFRVISNYTQTELNLPNKKYIAGLGIGARLVVFDENEKIIGLEIIDITYDSVSSADGKPIVEITVEKA